MWKWRNIKVSKRLIASIGCGFLGITLSALYLHHKEVEITGGGRLQRVLVAAVDIDQYTLMEPGLVEVRSVPKRFVEPGALEDPGNLSGMITALAVKRGEQILGTKLVLGGSEGGLSAKIPKGKRAVSVLVADSDAAGGLIRPDDYVDVFVTFDYGDSDHSDKYTYTLFQNVEVLAVNSKAHSVRDPKNFPVVKKQENNIFGDMAPAPESRLSRRDNIVTVALDADESKELILADQAGYVSLALRSPVDGALIGDPKTLQTDSLTGKAGFVRKKYREYKGR